MQSITDLREELNRKGYLMPVVLSSFTVGAIAVSVAEGLGAVSGPDPAHSAAGESDEETLSITFTEPEMGGDEAISHFGYRTDGNVEGYFFAVEGRSLEPPTRHGLAAVNREAPGAKIFYPTEIRGETGKHLGELLRGIANYVHECYVQPDKPNFIRSVEILLGDSGVVDAWRWWFSRYGERMHDVTECLQAVEQVKRHPVLTEKYKVLDRKVKEYLSRHPEAEELIKRITEEILYSPSVKVPGYVLLDAANAGRLLDLKTGPSTNLNSKMLNWSRAYEIELEELSAYKHSLAGWIPQEAMDGFLKGNLGKLGFDRFDRLSEKEKEAVARFMLRRMKDRAKGMTSEARRTVKALSDDGRRVAESRGRGSVRRG